MGAKSVSECARAATFERLRRRQTFASTVSVEIPYLRREFDHVHYEISRLTLLIEGIISQCKPAGQDTPELAQGSSK